MKIKSSIGKGSRQPIGGVRYNNGGESRSDFVELKMELISLKETFLGPLLQVYKRIEDKLEKMQEEIAKNSQDIAALKKTMNQQKEDDTTAKKPIANLDHSIDEVAKEVHLQNKNRRQLYVKAVDKKSISDTLNKILEREATIEKIVALPKVNQEEEESYIVELNTEAETRTVLRRKAIYFKLNQSKVSINAARTRRQRDICKSLNAAEQIGRDSTYETSVDRGPDPPPTTNTAGSISPPFFGFSDYEVPKCSTRGISIKKRRLMRKYR